VSNTTLLAAGSSSSALGGATSLVTRLAIHLILIVVCLVFLFPFYYMAIQSVMTQRELFSTYPMLFPNQFRYQNFVDLFQLKPFARIIFNTVFIATTSTLGSVLFSCLAGYTFAKFQFPGKNALFVGLLATMMLPEQITLIPKYLIMVNVLQWQNTYASVVVPRLVSAFGIFYLRQYAAASVHDELIEAATIDGSGFWSTFRQIALPLMLPGMTVFALLALVWAWNDFLWPLLMLNDPLRQTIPVALSNLKDSTGTAQDYWSLIIAGTTIGTFPLVAIFLLGQKYIVGGLASGAFKGL
jgi:cellobiose transport system permease protein